MMMPHLRHAQTNARNISSNTWKIWLLPTARIPFVAAQWPATYSSTFVLTIYSAQSTKSERACSMRMWARYLHFPIMHNTIIFLEKNGLSCTFFWIKYIWIFFSKMFWNLVRKSKRKIDIRHKNLQFIFENSENIAYTITYSHSRYSVITMEITRWEW